jgi:hypothetical protein
MLEIVFIPLSVFDTGLLTAWLARMQSPSASVECSSGLDEGHEADDVA